MKNHSKRILFVVIIGAALFSGTTAALACWQTLLQECFERPEGTWPWQNPPGSGRQWRHSPGDPNLHWGPQADFFNNSICPPEHDTQSCWCIGDPRTEDPEFDDYPANLDTYMTFGPLNLVGRSAARVTFYLLNASEVGHDSVFWGASVSSVLTNANMQIGGSYSGRQTPLEYQIVEMDLSNLRNFQTQDSVSMLDSATVFVFWRFKADNNNIRDDGAFVDEVVIRVDDNCLDLLTNELELFRANGRPLTSDPAIGDSIYAVMDFTTCDGAIDATYPAFRVMGTVGGDTILDELIQGADRNQRFVFNSDIWVVNAAGDFNVRLKVDTLNTVTECNEENNSVNWPYHVNAPNDPPQFTWLNPGTDTLYSDGLAMLRWECYDLNETAVINLLYDLDNQGCEGLTIPAGSSLSENDGADSLVWDLSSAPEGGLYYVFAQVFDAENSICVYSAHPVVKRTTAVNDPHANLIPDKFYLSQNFPNPFNPSTDISYGVAKGGHVELRVYDLLGREVALLVNGERTPGHYHANFSGQSLGSGIYLYMLTTPEGSLTHKMVMIK